MSTMSHRRQVVKACKKLGLHVQPAALQAMIEYILEGGEDERDEWNKILQVLHGKLALKTPKIISLPLWEETLQEEARSYKQAQQNVDNLAPQHQARKSSNEVNENKAAVRQTWRVVDAFDTPKLIYDALRQQFYYKTASPESPRASLFGSVNDRIEMMSQRFQQAQQRVARSVSHLTCVDQLLGTKASSTQVLLGLLRTNSGWSSAIGVPATGLELEDSTGTVPLQLHAKSQIDAMGLYTDGALVLISGRYRNGILVVDKLGLPPIERKNKTLPYLPPSPHQRLVAGSQSDILPLTLYSMSNVAVDEPDVVHKLETLVSQLSSDDGSNDNSILVLMGNFTTDSLSLTSAMDELSRILEPLPSTVSVLIVPGPKDTPTMCWPIPAIKSRNSFYHNLAAKVEFVSNPCRVEFSGGMQHVLISRHDLIRQYVAHELPLRKGAAVSQVPLFDKLANTILSQGHLAPQLPIYWNYDHALSLYPLPELVLLGLEERENYVSSAEVDCAQVVSPGANGNWAKVTIHAQKMRGSRSTASVEVSRTHTPEDDDMPPDFAAGEE
eukprot:Nitzschia sp. Nitz4//scaffold48_size128905//53809//55473//NITZ4_003596-RA/size128905-processed-gene-0.84-mRNA-1//1//CDS//3329552970//9453//frame0